MQAQGGGFGAGAGGGGGGGGGQHQALAPKAKYICGGETRRARAGPSELGADPGGARNAREHNGIAREHFVRARAHALARALQRVKGGAGDGRRPPVGSSPPPPCCVVGLSLPCSAHRRPLAFPNAAPSRPHARPPLPFPPLELPRLRLPQQPRRAWPGALQELRLPHLLQGSHGAADAVRGAVREDGGRAHARHNERPRVIGGLGAL